MVTAECPRYLSWSSVTAKREGCWWLGLMMGVLRMWRGWEDTPQLVTGWSLLPELVIQSLVGSCVSHGSQLAWIQTGQILVGAWDAKPVRLWDCSAEARLVDLPKGYWLQAFGMGTASCLSKGHRPPLKSLLVDPAPELRAAAVYALGTFINSCSERTEIAE
jgi:hypothetical protein